MFKLPLQFFENKECHFLADGTAMEQGKGAVLRAEHYREVVSQKGAGSSAALCFEMLER